MEAKRTTIEVRRTRDAATTPHLVCDQCPDTIRTIEDGDTLASLLATVSDYLTAQQR